MNCIWN